MRGRRSRSSSSAMVAGTGTDKRYHRAPPSPSRGCGGRGRVAELVALGTVRRLWARGDPPRGPVRRLWARGDPPRGPVRRLWAREHFVLGPVRRLWAREHFVLGPVRHLWAREHSPRGPVRSFWARGDPPRGPVRSLWARKHFVLGSFRQQNARQGRRLRPASSRDISHLALKFFISSTMCDRSSFPPHYARTKSWPPSPVSPALTWPRPVGTS